MQSLQLIVIAVFISAAITIVIMTVQNNNTSSSTSSAPILSNNPFTTVVHAFCNVKNKPVDIYSVPAIKEYKSNETDLITTTYTIRCPTTKTLELFPYVSAVDTSKDWNITGTQLVDVILSINQTSHFLSR
jgi:hypothetical protein